MLNLKIFFPILPRARVMGYGPCGLAWANSPNEVVNEAWEHMTFGGVKVDFIAKEG